MNTSRNRPQPQARFTWLLWLALLLPLAQSAAVWHGYSHWGNSGSSNSRSADAPAKEATQQSLHSDACDLCLTGAPLVGGAAAATAPALPSPPPGHQTLAVHHDSAWTAPVATGYQSRAPPFASC